MLSEPITERFLISRLSTFYKPWISSEWVHRNLPQLIEALQALERRTCYAVICAEDEVRCLSEAEYDALKEAFWQQSDGPKRQEEMFEKVWDVIQEQQTARIDRLREPGDN